LCREDGIRLLVGTSGFSYKEWLGSFYPEDLPAGEMLHAYGEKLPAVEINNTFYRLPKASVLDSWASQVPAGFRFVLKASRRITHIKRLNEAGEETAYLYRTAEALGKRLGGILFQLPPNLKKDIVRLRLFLDQVPDPGNAAFEFRHPTWQDDEVFDELRGRGCALCIADTDEEPATSLVATASWGYLRLRRTDYSEADLKSWAQRVQQQGWKSLFAFFKHEEAGTGPKLALRFLEVCSGHAL
jgi:uncharacterized protein YecE (DUF72 family)